jgi:ADP-ribose pyrophosphatase YjhB (NUDIX family)
VRFAPSHNRLDDRGAPSVVTRVPAGDERIRHRGDRVAVVERPVAGPDGVAREESARLPPGVRLVVVDADDVLLLPDGPRGPGDPRWRLPGGSVVDSLPAYEALRGSDRSVRDAADEAAPRVLREAVGLDPVRSDHLFVLPAGPDVDAPLYCYLVEQHRAARRGPDEPTDAAWVARDDVRAACLAGRVPEPRSALALLRWLADGDESDTGTDA